MLELTPSSIAELDKLADSPEVNASRVYHALRERCGELTDYELLCFSMQYLASKVLTGELAGMDQLIKALNRNFYYHHYNLIWESRNTATAETAKEDSSTGILTGTKSSSSDLSQKV